MKINRISKTLIPSAALLVILLILAAWLFGFSKSILIGIPIVSLAILGWSIVINIYGLIFPSSIVTSLSIAFVMIVWSWNSLASKERLGLASIAFGISWIIILFVSIFRRKQIFWWTILLAGVFISLGLCFIFSQAGIWDFVFYSGAGLGLTMLGWGIGAKLLGLIIAGSIVLTVAPGVAFSWKIIGVTNAISQTGVMLVWFGLGWALITICSRAIKDKFIWWPLIPGGILEMVGIGLYLGGNPKFTVGFINNTLIMSILIFGSYIFFLRLNFRK